MAPVAVEPQTFEDIEDLYCGSVYPGSQFFEGCETALCLFSAEWLGKQDVYWLAKMGLEVHCVDINGDNLARMRELYPDTFLYTEADAYEFAREAVREEYQWDAVTLDPWTSQFGQCRDMLETWTTIARKTVVMGHGNYRVAYPEAPEGWTLTHDVMRSDFRGGVWWLVYQRER